MQQLLGARPLWQQLAEIGKTGKGTLSVERVLVSALRMHHTAVLAAIGDYRRVDVLKRAGARRKRSRAQEEAEKYRVFPFITIDDDGLFQYTNEYKDALLWAGVKLRPEVIQNITKDRKGTPLIGKPRT